MVQRSVPASIAPDPNRHYTDSPDMDFEALPRSPALELLSRSDFEQIQEWNSRETKPINKCVHDILHGQALLTPDRVALCSWDGEMSYGELDRTTTQLGHYLVHKYGIQVEDVVSFTFEKSICAVVTMIAVMKAGGILMPLDPRMPQRTWHDRMRDFGAKLAVSSAGLASRIHAEYSNRLLVVDHSLLESIPEYSLDEACSDVRPENGLLLTFTSGSTGKPKGILQEHNAFGTSCRDHGAAMLITSESRTYQFSGYSFDTSLSDTFCTFLVGGCVCLPSDNDRLNNLAGSITALKANVACLTPSAADSLFPEDVPTLKVLSLGGEALNERLVERWAPAVKLLNIYGITECIVWCTSTDPIIVGANPSNIGRAVCGRTWIVDSSDHTKLAPVGAVGELLVEGPNMARHYVQNPEATAKAFVNLPDYFGQGSRRFYRTGDLVKYAADGTIDYIGRRDTQVKLAGQRVDLAHIEHCMQKCVPGTVEVCVVLAAQQRVLSGFVTDRSLKQPLVIPELKAQLANILPAYMVPGAIFSVSRLPSTPSGKIDRVRLSKMASELITDSAVERPSRPLTDAETLLQGLWATALGVNPEVIHPNSNFLQFGDSVSAMKLANISRKAGMVLSVSAIFTHPILSDMAANSAVELAAEETVAKFGLMKGETLPDAISSAASQCGTRDEDIEDIYPCTPLQEGLMALSIKEQGAYIARHVLRLTASTDLDRFRAACAQVVQANAILRTRFVQFSNQIFQAVLKEEPEWNVSEALETYLLADSEKHVGCGDRLIRLGLVSEGSSRFFVFTAHHSIYDGWSIPLILDQIGQAYQGQLEPPVLEFRSFIGKLMEADEAASATYWRGQLQDAQPVTFPPLTPANRQPHADSVREHTFSLPETHDVIMGTTLSGRSLSMPGIDGLVGPTITTVPVRVQLLQSQMVESFLKQLQDQATEMIPHEHFGLRRIRRLSPEAEAACGFQSLLILQPPTDPAPENLFEKSGLEIVENIRTFALALQVRVDGSETRLTANFDEDLIDGRYVTWMLFQMENILKQLHSNPFALLQDIKAFGQHDSEQIGKWLPGPPEFIDRCVHEIFMDRVKEMPNEYATEAWDGKMTYSELDQLSSRLAQYLSGQGIKPEHAVPILFEKSMWTQVALLGAIKAGATFVLLDPDHPVARLQVIVDDVEAKLILSSIQHTQTAQSLGIPVLTISKHMIEEIPHNEGQPAVSISPRQALYIHFSSGTTGKPKGSIIDHCSYASSASATCRAMQLYPGPESANRVLHFAAHSYDQCIGEMLGTIMHGGTLCIPSDFERNNDVIGSINKYACSRATFTPSFGRLVSPADVPTLRVVVVGGEAIAEQDIGHWSDGGVQLFNAYGPSETTVSSCVKAWPTVNSSTDFRSIGHPIDSAHYYIVEPGNHHQLTPLGGLGEIVIDSPTVARGYLKEPEKSKQAFVDRPAWLKGEGLPPGRKLYKTGDMARYTPDGEFVFLGRRDTQVKLRSQRLELAEVEHHVSSQLSPIDEVVAEMITIASSANLILAAFIRVGRGYPNGDLLDEEAGEKAEWTALQNRIVAHLGKTVPAYMIPTAFVPLRRVPLTNSHKVDRKRLHALAAGFTAERLAAFSLAQNGRAPETAAEKEMCKQWAAILGVDEKVISAEDNFFRLGGDSIDAMKLVAAVRARGFGLTMRTVFQYPRLSDMCLTLTEIAATKREEDDSPAPFSLVPEDAVVALRQEATEQCRVGDDAVQDIYPATPLQEGLIAVSAKHPGMEMAQMSFLLDEGVSVDRLKGAWEAIARRNAILRTRMITTKSGVYQVVVDEMIDWVEAKDMPAYAQKDREVPMLHGDKLCRFAVIEDEASGQAHLCITIHHALYDGWAWGKLLEQVEQVYAGEAVAISPPFNKFVRLLQAQDPDTLQDFWKSTLAGVSADIFPKLPTAFYTPKADGLLHHTVEGTNASNVTAANVVRAAWAFVISRYTENSDVVIGSTVTGRNAPIEGIQEMIGPAFATVPLRVNVDMEQSVDDFLQLVQNCVGSMDGFEYLGLQGIRSINADTETACSFQNVLVVQPEARDERPDSVLRHRHDWDEMATFNNYGIMLECTPSRTNMELKCSFDSDLINSTQMGRIMHQFAHVLGQLLTGGKQRLRDVDMVSPEDYREIAKWNSHVPEIIERCIHDRIEERVAQHPHVEAVCAWDGSFTYEEVSKLSSPLAARLYAMGARPNMIIPLCFEKSKWTLIAMMAVMKSGAAFVLLDPAHHSAEKRIELAQAVDAKIAISSPAFSASLASDIDAVITLSEDHLVPHPAQITVPTDVHHPDNTLCVMFTSGSTGKPKAIVHSHSGMYSSFEAFGPCCAVTSNSRVFQFAAYAFDASVGDHLATLMHGGCICIPSEADRINDFAGAFARLRANYAHLTPSLGRSLDPEKLPGMRTVIMGGEPLMRTEVAKWSERAHLLSAYGPAESSLCVAGTLRAGLRLPPNLGLPVGCRTWVVEAHDYTKLAPVGVTGQLVIEGPVNAAGGYLGDEERTKAGFIAPQHVWIPEVASKVNQRMYRTGDLARYSATAGDGSVEFVERRDTQIKLRGQRIELAEVEFCLKEALAGVTHLLPDIDESVVAKITPAESSSSHLAAFIASPTLAAAAPAEQSRLLHALLAAIAAYMAPRLLAYKIPTVIMPVAQMPRTPSRKVNRKELGKLAAGLTAADIAAFTREQSRAGRKPESEAEEKLCALVARILGLPEDQVFADDAFARLGGDSIQAMRLVALAREEGLALSVARLFAAESIAELAAEQTAPADERLVVPAKVQGPVQARDVGAALFEVVAQKCGVDVGMVQDVMPCTPMQEGLMSLTLSKPGAYVAFNTFALPPETDVDKFKNVWGVIFSRNDILRTRIVQVDGETVQVVLQDSIWWSSSRNLSEALEKEKATPMGLGTPLNRFSIVTSDTTNYFIWTAHHSTYDGWSMKLLLDQVEVLYQGSPAPTGPSFKRFVTDLSNGHAESSAYWTNTFEHFSAQTFPEPSSSGQAPEVASFKTSQIQFSRKTGSRITTSTLVRAAWAVLLRQYCEGDEVLFGTVSSGRSGSLPGIEGVVGPTLCTLPVVVKVNGASTVSQYLETVQRDWLGSLPHEHFGLQNIAHLSSASKAACNFQNLLVIQPRQMRESDESAVMGRWLESDQHSDFFSYPLTVQCSLDDAHCEVLAGYDSRLLNEEHVVHMLQQFDSILQQLCLEDQLLKVSELDVLGPQGLQQILHWDEEIRQQQTPPTPDNDVCIHDRISQLAASQPERPAVCAWDGEFTYAQLESYTSALADHLVSLGVRPETLVPFCMEKSAWVVVAKLAILRAGGAFVPMDPSYPREWQQGVVEQTQAKLVLTCPQTTESCAQFAEQVIEVSPKLLESLPFSNATSPRSALSDAAYVIFTSGSTGTPKGVVMEHGALSRSVTDHGHTLHFRADSRVLNFASYVFDVCIAEMLTTLAHGGCVCVPSAAERTGNIMAAMNRMRVNWALFTASFVRTLSPQKLPMLETVVVGGEPLDADIFQTWASEVCLIEAYGPAECCIFSTSAVGVSRTDDPALIGKSITGSCWIVDPNDCNRLAAVGSTGELLVEAPTLARGYLNDAAKTDAAFVVNPKWAMTENGQTRRMYKTGDLVKYNADGSMNFVGRKDTQVKLRGQRIELTLIEHHIRQATSRLLHVAVEKIKLSGGVQLLAAFLDFEDGKQHLDLSEELKAQFVSLQQHLQTHIPPHMVPSMYVPLAAMPLSIPGKIDRRALRDLAASLSQEQLSRLSLTDAEKRAPSTQSETDLRRLWAEVLRLPVDTIGVDDGFFQLGGDSIGAMRLATLAREHGIDITVQNILRNNKLCEMARTAKLLGGAENEEEEEEEEAWKKPPAPFALVDDPERVFARLEQQHAIPRREVEDAYACSPLQEGLLALSAKNGGTYTAQSVFRLHPFLDVPRFKKAWEAVVQRHSILRTVIVDVDGVYIQVVLKDRGVEWTTAAGLEGYLAEDKQNPMEPGTPLARYCIVEAEDDDYFVWTVHHAIYDGWSTKLLLEELEQLYHNKPLSPVVAPFSQVQAYFSQQDTAAADNYWKSRLADSSAATFPEVKSTDTQLVADAAMTHPVTFSRSSGSSITTPTLLRSAWALILRSYTGSESVLFGETFSGRDIPVPGITTTTGPTIATVPTVVHLDPKQTLDAYLAAVQTQTIDMAPFQHVGLQRIKELGPTAKAACNFQNLLVIQPADKDGADEQAPTTKLWSAVDDDAVSAGGFLDYPLVVECSVTATGATIAARYASAVFTAAHVERMLHQFSHVLQQLSSATGPATTLNDIDPLSPHDKRSLATWNSRVPETLHTTVHDLIAQQTALHPGSIAIDSWDATLTYAELDDASARLAQQLRSLGVRRGARVPVLFEKSAWVIVAMLAVLRAGGAYVPLDVGFPDERNGVIVRESGAEVVLVGPQQRGRVVREAGVREYVVDEAVVRALPPVNNNHATTTAAADADAEGATPDDPAFIIFTSGTTGRPKGIVLSHRAFCSSAHGFTRSLRITKRSRVLQFAGFVFDVSLSEIWGALSVGATLCIASPDARLSALDAVLRELRVTWAFLTPTVAGLLSPEKVAGLKTLVMGGERLTRDAIRAWAPRVALMNGYGPAECAVYVCESGALSADADPGWLGGRLGGNRFWIVDPADVGRLVPVGAVGELVVEGATLADGYLNDEVRTKAAFIEPPRWRREEMVDVPGLMPARMYRSGDLARFDPVDGSVHIIGRKDSQVKIHGQRAELGEIETHVAAALPEGWVAVAAMSKLGGELRLTAFVGKRNAGGSGVMEWISLEENEGASSTVQELRKKLETVLPPFMVPTAYVVVRNVALTPGGKVDRQKLYALGQQLSLEQCVLPEEVKEDVGPLSDMEERLRGLWAKVLKLDKERLGAESNFIQLGGDSISAMRLAHASRALGLSLSVRQIFTAPVLADMAAVITVEESSEKEPSHKPFSTLGDIHIDTFLQDVVCPAVGSTKDNIEDVLPATDYQAWTLSHNHLRSRGYNNYLTYTITGIIDEQRLAAACQTLVAHHAILRTVFAVHSRQLYQVVLKRLPTPLLSHHHHNTSPASAIAADMRAPLTLSTPRTAFLLCTQQSSSPTTTYSLTIRLSHAQYDGLSLPVLLADLRAAYAGTALSPSTPFSAFIHASLQHDVAAAEAEQHYRTLLHGARMTPIVGSNNPAAHQHRFPLSATQTRVLRVDAGALQASGLTFAAVLQAGWAVVLARMSGQADVVFGSVVAGRSSVKGGDKVVGPCMNVVPVRVRVGAGGGGKEAAEQVREQQVEGLPFETLGFRRVFERCAGWPAWTRFSSIVQFTSFEGFGEGEVRSGGDSEWRLESFAPPGDVTDVWVAGRPRGRSGGADGGVEEFVVDLAYSADAVGDEVAETMVEMLRSVVEGMLAKSESVVVDEKEKEVKHPRLPLQLPAQTTPPDSPPLKEYLEAPAEQIVKDVWQEVLGCGEDDSDDVSFWDLWGESLLAAAALSEAYGRRDAKFLVEELLDRPTRRLQAFMLSG
ncbi:Nonribosomal peptide synthetase vlmS [Lasiodiplodia theobromae]|uniref:Nonribosomal peptide synthetase vlmS n=1 Tax=Lasiodiplodia theobromae TaxID=45133 RepID=A0A5N5CW69_9PEZI|nr:Nonribosomal peptide synthetase vlmS [Lasiodiplodia theobromae]